MFSFLLHNLISDSFVQTKVAEEFNVAVFITNQVVSDPGASGLCIRDLNLFERRSSFCDFCSYVRF